MESDHGIHCPRCHGQLCRVGRTKRIDNGLLRYRKCEECRHNFSTTERTNGVPSSTGTDLQQSVTIFVRDLRERGLLIGGLLKTGDTANQEETR